MLSVYRQSPLLIALNCIGDWIVVPIRVLVAEDHALVREGTRRILEGDDEIEVVGEAVDGEDALAKVACLQPDILLLDIRMPQMNGIETTLKLREQSSSTAVLILSAYDEDDYVTALLDAGASGYLLKTVRSRELLDAVHRVYAGETVLHPEIARKVASLWRRGGRASKTATRLTEREMEVLRLVGRGLQNKEIARQLTLSVRTVEGHLRRIFNQLGVRSRTEAAIFAASQGWVDEDPSEAAG